MLRELDGKILALFLLLLVGLACSGFDSQETAENAEEETVNLPSKVLNQWEFQDAADESEVILLLTSDNELYQEQMQIVKDPLFDLKELKSTKVSITREQLPEKLKGITDSTDPEKKIVYLKVDAGARFDNVLTLLRSIRDLGISWVGLITEKKPEWSTGLKGLFRVELQASPVPLGPDQEVRPNPLVLVAMMDDSGNLKLNGEEKGTVSDTGKLETLLSAVLKERTEKGVFREGANEIEKTVLLRASGSSKYGDVVKLVDALKGSGADPIVIGLDEPEPVTAVEKLDSGSYDEDDSPGNTNSRE